MGFCALHQTREARTFFKENYAALYKIKRAVLEVIDYDSATIVIDKRQKKSFANDGHNLKY